MVQPAGCLIGAIPKGVPSNCEKLRGGVFNHSLSTTWNDRGWYSLNGGTEGFDANLGYGAGGFNLDYGLETLGLGFTTGDAPTLTNQTIAAYNLPNPMFLYVL